MGRGSSPGPSPISNCPGTPAVWWYDGVTVEIRMPTRDELPAYYRALPFTEQKEKINNQPRQAKPTGSRKIEA